MKVKILISTLLTILGISGFVFSPDYLINLCSGFFGDFQRINIDGVHLLLEYIGIGSLSFVIRIWREKIGINSFGILSGESVKQPSTKEINDEKKQEILHISEDVGKMYQQQIEDIKSYIDEKKEFLVVDDLKISRKFSISRTLAQKILLQLTQDGYLIRSRMGNSLPIYRSVDSIESRVINKYLKTNFQGGSVLKQFRDIKVSNQIIDLYIESEKGTYLIDVLISSSVSSVKRAIDRFMKIEKNNNGDKKYNYVILIKGEEKETDLSQSRENFKDISVYKINLD